MAGYSLAVKMQLSGYGSEGEWIQKQLLMATRMLFGLSAFCLEQQELFSARATPMVDLIVSYWRLELQMGL
jgi:hypothetical protein